MRREFLAVRPIYTRDAVSDIVVVKRGGEYETIDAPRPWFASTCSSDDETYFLARGAWGYSLRRAGIVRVDSPRQVRSVSAEHARNGCRVGLNNIKYDVRAALDLQSTSMYGILGLETPALLIGDRDEMTRVMERAVEEVSSLRVLVFDIEVYSTRGGFPVPGDPIISIAYAVFRADEPVWRPGFAEKRVRILVADDLTRDASVELVERFLDVLWRERPSILASYNGTGFDLVYLRPFVSGTRFSLSHDAETEIISIENIRGEKRFYPHFDLMEARDAHGSALGVRSTVARSLFDVSMIVLRQLESLYEDARWIRESEYVAAEERLDHEKLREYYERGDKLFYDYARADVLLTSILARVWIYPEMLLAVLTGYPFTRVYRENTGKIAEVVVTEHLRRLGVLVERADKRYRYERVARTPSEIERVVGGETARLFERGKVYSVAPGWYGGGGWKIVELDFDMLYPTILTAMHIDPALPIVYEAYEYSGGVLRRISAKRDSERDDTAEWILMFDANNNAVLMRVGWGYGVLSEFFSRAYFTRLKTKQFKKRAKRERRIELLAPDQAVKIFVNSLYGMFGKRSGNLLSEVVSAYVFWRSQRILYDVIRAVETVVSERVGAELRVVYGDTDSVFILAPESVSDERIIEEVNRYVKKRWGELFNLKHEATLSAMIIPRRKQEEEASAKSYILVARDGSLEKVAGEFYKLTAPQALRERLDEFYRVLIARRPRSKREIHDIIDEIIRDAPLHKLFTRTSIRQLVNTDNGKTRLKRLNKSFHYAALVRLCESGAEGTRLESGGSIRRCTIDARRVERTSTAVIVQYMPHKRRDSRRFAMLVEARGGAVRVFDVSVRSVSFDDENLTITIEYVLREEEWTRERTLAEVHLRYDRHIASILYEKLVRAWSARQRQSRIDEFV